MLMNSLKGLTSFRVPMESRQWLGDVTGLRSVLLPRLSQEMRPVVSGNRFAHQSSAGHQSRRIFVDFTFYRTKGAMRMKPIKPSFRLLDTGDAALAKEGSLLLEFAPSVSVRQYDWNRKQIFALSVFELGTLVGLPPGENCEFFHDPHIGKSDAGKVRKSLKVEPMTDKPGYFMNLNVSNKMDNTDDRFVIALTRSDFSVLRSSMNFIIPYLMGWHVFADPSKLEDSMFVDGNSPGTELGANEWTK